MSGDTVRIVFKADDQELHSEVLIESLQVWIDHGWTVASDFLSDEEDNPQAAPEFDYSDWTSGRAGETAVTESDEDVVETVDEEN